MNRSSLITVVDVLAFIAFVFLTSTGVLMRYILPPGSGRWTTLWGMDRHEWGTIHLWIAVAFLSILTLHLVLHWRFIASLFTGRAREGSAWRVLLGLLGLIAVLAMAAAPFLSPIETGSPLEKGRQHHRFQPQRYTAHVPRLTPVPVQNLSSPRTRGPVLSGERPGRGRPKLHFSWIPASAGMTKYPSYPRSLSSRRRGAGIQKKLSLWPSAV